MRKAAGDPAFKDLRRALAGSPALAVYTGQGASHSWIWFCDLAERLGTFDVRFVTASEILGGCLQGSDFLLVGGGDTYAMAESLGEKGAALIEAFVREGGLYHGSCAGAYLVLSGVELEPFTPFRLVDADMVNVMADPPAPRCLDHKYLAPYGTEWVFHPVYGEVSLARGAAARDYECFTGGDIAAPLFGGPVLSVADVSETLAGYSGATSRAAFLWPAEEAEMLLAGREAVAIVRTGRGTAVASGPHLEHPVFPRANALMGEAFARHWRDTERRAGRAAGGTAPAVGAPMDEGALLEIKREVSNARIVGFGLEKMPVTWRIGVKVWEPEKIRMFLETAWTRLPRLEQAASDGRLAPRGSLEALAEGYRGVTILARTLKLEVESGQDSQAEAESLLTRLKELTASFLTLYFALRLEEQGGPGGPLDGDGADG